MSITTSASTVAPSGSTHASPRSRRTAASGRAGIPTYVILTCLAIFAIGPIVLFFFNAVKTQQDYGRSSLGLPNSWQWGNFSAAWSRPT